MIYFDEQKQAWDNKGSLEKAGHRVITSISDSTWNNYATTDKWDIIDGFFTDITNTAEYINKQQKINLKIKLAEVDQEYYLKSQEPVDFEGKKYKFEWTSLYSGILNEMKDNDEKLIWDLTELEENATLMSKSKLQELQNTLLAKQEPAFQDRKIKRSNLKKLTS